jgi:hypothetical protein
MEKKKIIIALIVVFCICVGIGTLQAVKNKGENETTVSSTTVVSTTATTNAVDSTVTPKSTTAQATQTTTTNTTTVNTTKVATTKAVTTKKSNNTTTKKSTTKVATTKKSTTTAKATTTKKVTTTKKEVQKTFNVSLTISCKNAVNYGADVPEYMLKSVNITVTEGDSVYDALQKACKSNSISLSGSSSYVKGIGGLNEKDCGGSSGWMYRVNGVTPNKSAGKYLLSSGDKIEWYYVTSINDK